MRIVNFTQIQVRLSAHWIINVKIAYQLILMRFFKRIINKVSSFFLTLQSENSPAPANAIQQTQFNR